jgi:hypothetical protein
VIGEKWDIPRMLAWNKVMGGLPPLAFMVGRFIGYEVVDTKPVDPEEHNADLISKIMGGAR